MCVHFSKRTSTNACVIDVYSNPAQEPSMRNARIQLDVATREPGAAHTRIVTHKLESTL